MWGAASIKDGPICSGRASVVKDWFKSLINWIKTHPVLGMDVKNITRGCLLEYSDTIRIDLNIKVV